MLSAFSAKNGTSGSMNGGKYLRRRPTARSGDQPPGSLSWKSDKKRPGERETHTESAKTPERRETHCVQMAPTPLTQGC
eukprot:198980-Rhodomonas_salina.3